ncbi:MAG: ubiquitin-specific protease doa4, partial [Vezdaea acicularis]
MTVSTTTTINGPSTSKSTSKYPSFDDILDRFHAELENYNAHIPIRILIQECDNREKQSTAFLDFKRPDRAFVDYIVAYEICVNVVPQNQDFSRLKGDQAQLWRQYQDVRARIISKGETFSRIKNDIRKTGILGGPTTGSGTDEARAMNAVPSLKDTSESDALSTLKSTQDIAYSSKQEDSELASQARHGNSSPKRRPKVSPKPPNLHGKSFSTNNFPHNKTSDQTDYDTLAERFSKLRGTDGTNDVLEKSRGLSSGANLVPEKTSNVQSFIRMPSPKDFIPESRAAIQDHSASDRTLPFQTRLNGPRAMPSPSRPAPVLPDANPELQLMTLMPRPPSPAYSPATAFPPSTNLSQPRPITRNINELGGNPPPPAANTSWLRNVDDVDQDETLDMGGNSRIIAPNRKSQIRLSEETTIDAETLNDYFRKGSHNLRILVIDVRDRADFDEGHILTQSIICIEPIVVRPGTSAEELEEALEISPDSERKLFARRDTYNLIVIYDQKSTSYQSGSGAMSDLKDGSALENLRKCLTDYSYKKRLQRDPILLRGGLDAWVDLVGPRLLATFSEPSLTEGVPNSRLYSAADRPIGRTPVAGTLYNFE